MGRRDQDALGRIAKLYYEYNYTHQQIADLIGWNRVKVTRALQEAREQGIVHITVFSDEPIFVEEERVLCERSASTGPGSARRVRRTKPIWRIWPPWAQRRFSRSLRPALR